MVEPLRRRCAGGRLTQGASRCNQGSRSLPRFPYAGRDAKSAGFDGDKLGGIIGAADALDREAAEKEQDAAALYDEIDRAIRKIGGKHGVERRTVLQCRYLDTMAWQDVAYLVFGDRTDYSDKFDSFQRRVFNIHKAALEDLAQVLDL